ncbi:MAG TPA: DUF58 domain-containing protein [Acidimicrobiales bacterium]|nr:DUF58 domain-containing protein [Acidimicrobiales bacterium]
MEVDGAVTRLVIRPTMRGLGMSTVVATMVALAVLTGSPGPVALAAALAVPLIVAPVVARMRARRAVLGVKVLAHVVPPMVPVGGSSSLELTVVNAARRPMPPLGLEPADVGWRPGHLSSAEATTAIATPATNVTTTDATSTRTSRALDRLAPGPVELRRLPPLEPGGSTSATWRVPTARRGMFVLAPRRVWAHDPMGLFGVAVAAAPGVVVVVHPRPALDVVLPYSAGVGTGATAPASWVASLPTDTGVGGELADLRPYVPGDRLHLLHWPAFARYGTLLVRRFDPETGAVLRLVVDDRAGVHRRDAFEQALSATLAIIVEAADLGIVLELATLSGSSTVVAPTPQGVASVLPLLSTMQPGGGLSTMQPGGGLSTMQPGGGRGSGPVPAWVDSGSGSPTIVTTVTGEPRLPPALRRCAKVVV